MQECEDVACSRRNAMILVVYQCGGFMYIEGYIFVFGYTEEIGLLYMFPLIPLSPSISLFSKNRSDAVGDAPNPFVSFLNIFFLCFKEKSISVCITVLYYILILIVHFGKSMYKRFAENNTTSAHISKYQIFHPQPIFKPFLQTPSTLKVIID